MTKLPYSPPSPAGTGDRGQPPGTCLVPADEAAGVPPTPAAGGRPPRMGRRRWRYWCGTGRPAERRGPACQPACPCRPQCVLRVGGFVLDVCSQGCRCHLPVVSTPSQTMRPHPCSRRGGGAAPSHWGWRKPTRETAVPEGAGFSPVWPASRRRSRVKAQRAAACRPGRDPALRKKKKKASLGRDSAPRLQSHEASGHAFILVQAQRTGFEGRRDCTGDFHISEPRGLFRCSP